MSARNLLWEAPSAASRTNGANADAVAMGRLHGRRAAGQVLRNAQQKELTATLGTVGATHVRFLFGLPFGAPVPGHRAGGDPAAAAPSSTPRRWPGP